MFTAKEEQVTNNAGGVAIENSPEHIFMKLMMTGMMSDTYYAKAVDIEKELVRNARLVDPEFLAKAIVYAREKGLMRDNPIAMLVVLSTIDAKLFYKIFPRVILNARDLLKFAVVVDSGVYRLGFGTAPRKRIAELLNTMDPFQFIKNSSDDQRPNLKDIVRMVHPKPTSDERHHLLRWVLGKKPGGKAEKDQWEYAKLPEKIRALIDFKKLKQKKQDDLTHEEQNEIINILRTGWIPDEIASSFKLTKPEWNTLASSMSYGATLYNVGKMQRNGLFEDKQVLKNVCDRLSSKEGVEKSRVLPYKLMLAYFQTENQLDQQIKTALGTALQHALANIPDLTGKRVKAYLDISGSMRSGRINPRSAARYVDVGAMILSALMKKNPEVELIGFDTRLWKGIPVDANDTIFTNVQRIINQGGGGTDVSLPFRDVLDSGAAETTDVLICITDNESWFSPKDAPFQKHANNCTVASHSWSKIQEQNPAMQGVMINLTPYITDQFPEDARNLTMISGFSDEVFTLMSQRLNGGLESQIEAVKKVEIGD